MTTDPRMDAAAARRDLPAVVDAVSDRLAMPAEPSGPLAVCARALADAGLVDMERAPAAARVAAEALLRVARSCRDCGQIHPVRYGTGPKGEERNLTWDDAADGHGYMPTYPPIHWLDKILKEGA